MQVEHVLFPELEGLVLELPSVGVEEGLVCAARKEALSRLCSNLPGPHRSVSLVDYLELWEEGPCKMISSLSCQVCGCHIRPAQGPAGWSSLQGCRGLPALRCRAASVWQGIGSLTESPSMPLTPS